jgi:hypothetical protein
MTGSAFSRKFANLGILTGYAFVPTLATMAERPCPYFGTVVDLHHFNADPDPAYHMNVDQDLASQNNAYPDPPLWYILWIQVFPRRTLAEILMKMMTSLPAGQLTEQKLDTLR